MVLPKVIFVLGRPGAGKSMQCSKIAREHNAVYIPIGDIVREEMLNPQFQYADFVKNQISNGKLLPGYIICELLSSAMLKYDSLRFIIDGFPRNEDNFFSWNHLMYGRAELVAVLHFDCPSEVCMQRCLQRSAGRTDDNRQTLYKRFSTYTSETKPLIDYFNRNELVHYIDSNQSPDKIYENLKFVFSNLEHIW